MERSLLLVAQYDFIAVYILTNHKRGTLYTGVSSDLPHRIEQHRTTEERSFTRQYGLMRLVWFERHDTMDEAIRREKRIKDWKRLWKIQMIEKSNPDWDDISAQLIW